MRRFLPVLDALALFGARWAGRILPRPSEALLTDLASTARPGPKESPQDSPMVAASHHIQLGQSAFAAQSYGEALHHFATALNHAPNAPWALHGRGDALQLSGRHQAALEAYKKAIANNDDCGLHHAGAANALAALGRQKDADLAWDSALERDPSLSWMRKGSKNP